MKFAISRSCLSGEGLVEVDAEHVESFAGWLGCQRRPKFRNFAREIDAGEWPAASHIGGLQGADWPGGSSWGSPGWDLGPGGPWQLPKPPLSLWCHRLRAAQPAPLSSGAPGVGGPPSSWPVTRRLVKNGNRAGKAAVKRCPLSSALRQPLPVWTSRTGTLSYFLLPRSLRSPSFFSSPTRSLTAPSRERERTNHRSRQL